MSRFMREFRWVPRTYEDGREQGPPVKKAMGYVARNILKVEQGQATRPNEGPRWWMDPKASRLAPTAMSAQWRGTYDGEVNWPASSMPSSSRNKRTPSRSPLGSRESKQGRSETPVREHPRKSEDELLHILTTARFNYETHDPPRTSLTVADFRDMMGMAARVYRTLDEP